LKTPQIVLASRSPRRRVLLKQLGLEFKIHPSRIPEEFDSRRLPEENAKRLATAKAVEVSGKYSNAIIISADTIVVLGKRVLGKPASGADAARMLRMLSGKEHMVITAFTIFDCRTGKNVTGTERTRVKFRRINVREIRSYVASGSPMDKAGAYGIQDDYGAVFVEKVNGCFYNVVGFPLMKFHLTFRKFLKQLHYH
jgi:septum formation protein